MYSTYSTLYTYSTFINFVRNEVRKYESKFTSVRNNRDSVLYFRTLFSDGKIDSL